MGDGGNNPQAQKTASAIGRNPRRGWMSTTTQVFAYGWTFAIPLIAFLWTIVILIYSLSLPSGVRWGVFATAVITGSCSFLAGGLIGLLFGIPRSALGAAGTTHTGQYQANSNLVEVSDWLTKIIVGVGLVQIGRLEPALSRLAANLKAPLGDQPSSAAFGVALVIANVLLGFLFFYLWARSLLQRDLELSDGFADGDGAEETVPTPVTQTVVTLASERLSLPGQSVPAAQPSAAEAT
ncbi:MAG TPA: hypothetical protein VIL16_14855 [Trebonia sp.]